MNDKERLEVLEALFEDISNDMMPPYVGITCDTVVDVKWVIQYAKEQAEQNEYNQQALINQEKSSDAEIERLRERVQELEKQHKEYVTFTESNNYNMDVELEKVYKQNKRYREALVIISANLPLDGRDHYVAIARKALESDSE